MVHAMKRAFKYLLILNVCWLVGGCDPNHPQARKTDFSDSGFETGEETSVDTEPFLVGKRDYEGLRDVDPPPVVQERLPGAPKPSPKSALKLSAPKLVIDVDLQEMDFKFTVESARGTENVHLKGTFDRSAAPWVGELYAVDQRILEERRVGATVLCLTANYCDVIGVDVYYRVNGKTEIKQLQSGVAGPRVAMSGDGAPAGDPDDESAPAAEESVSAPPIIIDPATGKPPEPPPVATPPPPPAPEMPRRRAPPPQARAIVPIDQIPAEQLKDRAIEVPDKLNIPLPAANRYRVDGLPKAPSQPSSLIVQAIGHHSRGRLEKATYLPLEGNGFVRAALLNNRKVTPEMDRAGWGTQKANEYFSEVVGAVQAKFPGQFVTLGNVSKKMGGRLAPHSSHQTGLDLDVYFLSASNRKGSFVGCQGGRVSPEFDLAKNWEYFKILVGIRPNQVIAIFLHDCLKQALCAFAKKQGEPLSDPNSLAHKTLKTLVPESYYDRQKQTWIFPNTHHDHAHVRLTCPDTKGCGNQNVSLPSHTGCK